MTDLPSNELHEQVMTFFSKSRLDAKFVKKITLEVAISQQMKEEEHDQNN